MAVVAVLTLALLTQEPSPLIIGKAVDGVVSEGAREVRTPTLDAGYQSAPTVAVSFPLAVPESGHYFLDLHSFDFDAYLILEDDHGAVLSENDDGLLRTHARITAELHPHKEYRVRVCALHGDRGRFRLELCAGTAAELTVQDRWKAKVADTLAHMEHDRERSGVQSEAFASRLNELGFYYYSQGLLEDARSLFERSLVILRKVVGPEHVTTADSMTNLGCVLQDLGNLQTAFLHLEGALKIREVELGPLHPLTAASLDNFADLLKAMGDYDGARPLIERALVIAETTLGPSHPDTAISLNNLARLHHLQGRLENARELYERALAIKVDSLGPEHPGTALGLSNLAVLLLDQGNQEEARALLERSLQIFSATLGAEHPATALSLNNLATLYRDQGDYGKAILHLERALEIREKAFGPRSPITADTLDNLGSLLRAQGDFDGAQLLHVRALDIRQEVLGLDHPAIGTSLNNLAVNLIGQGKHDDASPLLDRVLRICELTYGPGHPQSAKAMTNLARCLLRQGRNQEALRLLQKSMEGFLSHLDQEFPSMSESGRLQILEISVDPGSLLTSFIQSDRKSSNEVYSLFLNWKGKATRVQAADLRLRQTVFEGDLRDSMGQIQMMSKQLSELVLLPLGEQESDHAQNISSLRKKRLALERSVNRQLGLDQVLATPGIEEMRSALPENGVVVDFYVGSDVFAWVLAKSGEPQLQTLGSREELQALQAEFLRARIQRGGKAIEAEGLGTAAELRKRLWEPLQTAIGDSEIVFLSPDGFLCELPFGSLKDKEGDYLLEKHCFVYQSDSTRMVQSQEALSAMDGSLLVAANVDYFHNSSTQSRGGSTNSTRSHIPSTWNSLPATKNELAAIRDLHDHVLNWESPMDVLQGEAATEEAVRQGLPGHRFVHIATHGFFEPEYLPSLLLDAQEKNTKPQIGEQIQAVGMLPGLLSGLVFAGVNAELPPGSDDGFLSAEEIQHLDLSACDLVVLSACETALGSPRAGEGLMSLRRSFEVAGARTVVSSLWKVDDQATATLMKDFYTNLWQKRLSRGEALHQAKLRMLRRNRIEYAGDARPGTWGAFVLSGDWN